MGASAAPQPAQRKGGVAALAPARIAGALMLAGLVGPVAAQTALTPGAVMETVRPAGTPLPAEPGAAPVVPAGKEEAGALDPNAPRFTVNAFHVTGAVAVGNAELEALLAPHAGKAYNLFELHKLLQLITTRYREAGYPVARAVIPAQKITDGVVQVEVIEGRVDQVAFSGNERYDDAFLARWGKPLVGETVRLPTLEERMLLIDDLPGLETRAILAPGKEYATTSVEVQVDEKPYEGSISVNNHGRREVGSDRVDAAVNLNNPLRIGDQLGIRTSISEQGLLKLAGLSYSLPLNTAGTRLGLSYTRVEYGLTGKELDVLDLEGKSELGSITLLHPLRRSRTENLYGTFAVRTFHGTQFALGEFLSASNVTVAEVGLAWNRVSLDSVTTAGLRVSANGQDSDHGTRTDGNLFKIDGEASYLKRLSSSWDVKLDTAAMWSPDSLADSERFSLGGPSSVRGYPSASVLGDRGMFASVEGRYRISIGDAPAYFSVFADGGYAARAHVAAGTADSVTLSSVGVGFSVMPTKWLSAQLIAAVPTGQIKDVDGHDKGRAWFSLTTTF